MQGGVLQRDGQTQPRPAQGPLAGGVRPVEPVEDLLDDVGAHADAVVAHPDGHGVVGFGDGDVDAGALGVLEGVNDEVAQNALDARGIDLGDDRSRRRVEDHLRALGLDVHGNQVEHTQGQRDDVGLLGAQLDAPGVDARNLQQVGEHGLETVDLPHEDLETACGERILDLLARLPDLLAGQADRGQRRAQLVGDVGDEQPLDLRQLLPGLDLRLQGGRHLVEGARQGGDLILPVNGQTLAQASAGQALGGQRGSPNGDEHAPGHGPDAQDEHEEESRAGNDDGPGGQVDDVLLGGQGVD